ncbi:MAG: hypothetical protein H6642_10095 [Caldilineaceae bacterium]|nr:hypothetical protein [Caldilineaceae bacterium]
MDTAIIRWSLAVEEDAKRRYGTPYAAPRRDRPTKSMARIRPLFAHIRLPFFRLRQEPVCECAPVRCAS